MAIPAIQPLITLYKKKVDLSRARSAEKPFTLDEYGFFWLLRQTSFVHD